MLFNSINFLCFFPIVLILYFILPKKIRYIWLLICSYFFYMCWNPKYILLIGFSTVITFAGGVLCEKFRKHKKLFLVFVILANLLLLCFFKYTDFIVNNMNSILGVLSLHRIDKKFDILLPVGISFYTFQALSYTIDVYRGTIKAEKNIFKYALFVSFFPQLVAGPIERSGNLISQINELENRSIRDLWNYQRIKRGFLIMLWGYFLKMVIADRMAILVNTVFDSFYMYNSFALICAAIGFAIQIYCDFSSYSLIAIGAAKVMGFDLMENFDTPYFSMSIKEFWRRWHISLSTWFRDYLYIPLGGSRCSKGRKYINLFITFLVSGLWHGASWNYVVWGMIHGLYQIVGDYTQGIRTNICGRLKVNTDTFSYKFGKMVTTFILTDIAWIFFRVKSLKDGLIYIQRIFTRIDPWSVFDQSCYTWGLNVRELNILLLAIIVMFIVDKRKYLNKESFESFMIKQNILFQWCVIIGLLFTIIIFGVYGPTYGVSQFIYFQF